MSTKVVAARQQASRFRPFVIGLVSGALFVFLAACTFLYSRQDRMVFPTPTKYAKTTPSDVGIPFEDLHIAMNGSEQIHAWWLPASSSSDKVLLAFHGSGYVLEQVFNTNNLEVNFLHSLGSNLLFVEYRGYGSSSAGVPSENRVYDDARAAFTYLTVQRKVPSRDIILVGRSLGTAPATEMAKEHPDCAGLILISPFTSMSDAARIRYWYLRAMPLSFMMRNRFDNFSKIDSVRVPIFITVGTEDRVTPPAMVQRLFQKANQPKLLYLAPGAGHGDIVRVSGLESEMKAFIGTLH